jgi:DNA-binding NarL/FixJ family response regulator
VDTATQSVTAPRTSLVIGDDHPIVLEGLRRLLSDEFEISAAVGSGRELIEAARRIRPHVILTDLLMQDMDGIEVARRLRDEALPSRVIVLTMYDEPERVMDAFAAGASGYVLKGTTGLELERAIREVVSGRTYLSSSIAVGVLSRMLDRTQGGIQVPELTRRQTQILRLVAEGNSLKAMARTLGISRRTVESHKYELMRKLGVSSTAELVVIAIRMGIVRSPVPIAPVEH